MIGRIIIGVVGVAAGAVIAYRRSQKIVEGVSPKGIRWTVGPEARQIFTRPTGRWSVRIGARSMGTWDDKAAALESARSIP